MRNFTIIILFSVVACFASPSNEEKWTLWQTTCRAEVTSFSIIIGDAGPEPAEEAPDGYVIFPPLGHPAGTVMFYHWNELYENGILDEAKTYLFTVLRAYPNSWHYRADTLLKISDIDGNPIVDQTKCNVHGTDLVIFEGEIVYGLRMLEYASEELQQFPNYDKTVHGGCFVRDQKRGVSMYCVQCAALEQRFRRQKITETSNK